MKLSKKQLQAIHARGHTVWEAKLEEPSQKSGTSVHQFELGRQASVHEVKNALMRMTLPNGSFRYYEQDVNKPYLHYIKKIGSPNKNNVDKVQVIGKRNR